MGVARAEINVVLAADLVPPPVVGKPSVMHVETPLLRSDVLSARTGTSVWLKLENQQISGSFKYRGISLVCSKVGSNLPILFRRPDPLDVRAPGSQGPLREVYKLFW